MPTSVRLDPELDALVARTARAMGKPKSDVIRAAVRAYCTDSLRAGTRSFYSLVEDLIGQAEGPPDLSANVRKHVLEILDAKRRRAR